MATAEAIRKKYGVSASAYNSKISEVHILEISQKYCAAWRDLPTPLGLNKMAASDLEFAPGGEGSKRKKFLERWQQEKGSEATYRELISALLTVQSKADAEEVCKLLQGDASSSSAAQTQAQATGGASAPADQDDPYPHYEAFLNDTAASWLDNVLDWDTKGVDKTLSEIAKAMIDWEEKLAPVLGLTDVEIHDIKRDRNNTGEVLLRRAVLKKWKQKRAFRATYRNLLKLCCEAEDFSTAQAICDVLNKKAGGSAPAAKTTPTAAAPTPAATTSTPAAATSTPAEAKGGKPTLLQLCKDLKPLAGQWKTIGELLELEDEDLKEVVAHEADLGPTKCLMKTLKVWLEKHNPSDPWEAIKDIKEVL